MTSGKLFAFPLRVVLNKITEAVGQSLYQKRIALLRLAFKEGTNDVRHSLLIKVLMLLVTMLWRWLRQ
jgi:UDP-glucose 6-dehydrogenase